MNDTYTTVAPRATFGMPVRGRALASLRALPVTAQTCATWVADGTHAGNGIDVTGVAPVATFGGAFPVPHAWRPPS